MSSFLVSGDDSTTRTITDAEVLRFHGSGNTTVSLDIHGNIVINSTSNVPSGTQGRLAWYQNTGVELAETPPDFAYDFANSTLYVPVIHPNAIVTDQIDFAVFNVNTTESISFGGTFQETEYSGRVTIVDLAYDAASAANLFIKTVHNNPLPNSLTFGRSRGTLAAETKVVAGDSIGSVLWTGWDGETFGVAANIGTIVETTPVTGSGIIKSGMYIQTADSTGTLQTAIYVDPDQYTNFTGVYRSVPQIVDLTSSNVTLLRKQIRSNVIFTIGTTPSIRDLILENASDTLSGLKLLIINGSNHDVNIKDQAGNTISTVPVSGAKDVLCTGGLWVPLN
jgi:hypothetical protein